MLKNPIYTGRVTNKKSEVTDFYNRNKKRFTRRRMDKMKFKKLPWKVERNLKKYQIKEMFQNEKLRKQKYMEMFQNNIQELKKYTNH